MIKSLEFQSARILLQRTYRSTNINIISSGTTRGKKWVVAIVCDSPNLRFLTDGEMYQYLVADSLENWHNETIMLDHIVNKHHLSRKTQKAKTNSMFNTLRSLGKPIKDSNGFSMML